MEKLVAEVVSSPYAMEARIIDKSKLENKIDCLS